MRRAECTALAALVALGLTACGTRGTSSTAVSVSTSHAGGPTRTAKPSAAPAPVTVAPHAGAPATVVTVRFVAPASTGPVGQIRIAYTVSVAGGHGSGCLGAGSVAAGAATKGLATVVAMDPARLGSHWCPGTHEARVVETAGPVCKPGAMCPQYVRVIGTVGTARFTVSG